MNQPLQTPLLDTVPTPDELRQLKPEQLRQLSDELRAEMIDAVSVSGGHLGSGLGVVELTVAIHYVFNTPDDRLIWDVGHQCYPHKILTGRRDRIRTIRQGGGLSGFTSSMLTVSGQRWNMRPEFFMINFGNHIVLIGILQPARSLSL